VTTVGSTTTGFAEETSTVAVRTVSASRAKSDSSVGVEDMSGTTDATVSAGFVGGERGGLIAMISAYEAPMVVALGACCDSIRDPACISPGSLRAIVGDR
jgi:hypothetical protein